MALTDPLGDMLTRIRNGQRAKKDSVLSPASKLRSHVLEVLEKVCSSVVILRKGRVVAQDSLHHLRELMHQPSLEGIFAQLTRDDDPAVLAGRVLQVMKA